MKEERWKKDKTKKYIGDGIEKMKQRGNAQT